MDGKAPPADVPPETAMAKLTKAVVLATAAQVPEQFVVKAR